MPRPRARESRSRSPPPVGPPRGRHVRPLRVATAIAPTRGTPTSSSSPPIIAGHRSSLHHGDQQSPGRRRRRPPRRGTGSRCRRVPSAAPVPRAAWLHPCRVTYGETTSASEAATARDPSASQSDRACGHHAVEAEAALECGAQPTERHRWVAAGGAAPQQVRHSKAGDHGDQAQQQRRPGGTARRGHRGSRAGRPPRHRRCTTTASTTSGPVISTDGSLAGAYALVRLRRSPEEDEQPDPHGVTGGEHGRQPAQRRARTRPATTRRRPHGRPAR